jgi:hypothetical protein
MSGFSTIGGGSGGSAQQVNFSISANASQTVSALYIANGIVDVAGLLVAIYNNGASAITLTAASGSIVNTASWTAISTSTTVTIQPNQTVTLETNLANLNYFINDYSQIGTVWGGSAGQLLWQSAPNTTGFIPTGTTGYMLQCNGTSIPTWVPVAVPSVQGGFAGQLLYQTATNATGFVTDGTAGQFLLSNGSSMPTWGNIAQGQGVYVSTAGSTTTIAGVRSFTFGLSGQTTGTNINTMLTNFGITDYNGNLYTFYNNTSANFEIPLNAIYNGNSWVNNSYFIAGASVWLYPNQTVNIQTYTVGATYTVESTSQTQSVGFSAQITSEGDLPASTNTLMNFISTSDPWGAFNNTTHAYVIPKAGLWNFTAATAFGAISTVYTANIQIQVNGNQKQIGFLANNSNTAGGNQGLWVGGSIFCNVGDQVTVTNWISIAGVAVQTGTQTSFTGMLVK